MLLKTKDYFTLGNVMGGFMCIIFVIQGKIDWASYSILIAYAFDVSDGLVARLTKQYNKFGAELDNVADLVAYSIAPSFLIYGYYTTHPTFPHPPWLLTVAISSLPTLTGCIRFARFNVKRLSLNGAWVGFPRPGAALLYIGYFNSIIANKYEFMYWFGLFVVIYASVMHFVLVPFYNHHREEGHPFYMKLSFFFIFSSWIFTFIADFFVGQRLVFDVIMIWLLLYLFLHRRLSFPPSELAEIRRFVKEWKADEAKIT